MSANSEEKTLIDYATAGSLSEAEGLLKSGVTVDVHDEVCVSSMVCHSSRSLFISME